MQRPQTRILVCDDAEFVRETLRKTFESKRGYEVLCARNGREALGILERTDDIDVLVVDITMPILDGCAVVAKVSTGTRRPALVIVVGKSSEREQLAKCIAMGADEALTKPLHTTEMLALVERRLAGGRGEATQCR